MKLIKFFKKFAQSSTPVEPVVQTPPSQPEMAPSVHVLKPAPKAAPVLPPVSPLSLKGGAKTQADWMLLQIGKTGRAFILHANKSNLSQKTPPASAEAFVRHDMTAALLGYRLVLTAYHLHQDIPSLEALRIVRTAMVGMLHRAVDITVEQTGKKELRPKMLSSAEEQFRFAESEIATACASLKTKQAEPFAPFYSCLAPAFVTEGSAIAPILFELFEKIESTMAARNHQFTG